MKRFQQLPILFLLALWSFAAPAQSVSSVSISPNQNNCNTLLTATVQGLLPNLCTSIDASVTVQGSIVNVYLTFTTQPGVCTQVVTPFTQNIIVGILPVGSYTLHVYQGNSGVQMCTALAFTVSCSGSCQPPAANQLYASNITFNSIRINCTTITGVVYYQFLFRQVGTSIWYSAPYSSNNYWNMTGLVSNANYEYRCRVYCNNGWTNYSPSQYCSTLGQSSGTNCSNAIALVCGVTYSGSNNYGTNSYSNYTFPNGSQFTNMTGAEAFHQFTLTGLSNVNISLTGLSQNLHLFLLSNCNSSCNTASGIGYSCNTGNNNEQLTMNNLPAGTYILLVDGWQGAHCNYNLTVQCTAVITCTAPTYNQMYCTNLTSNSVRLNCSASGGYYDWAYRPAGGSWINLPSGPNNYYDLTNLQPGVTYQFIVAIRCSNYVWSNWSPICACTIPNNNPGSNCSNALEVSCGHSYGGNNGTGGYNYSNYTYNGQTSNETGPEVVYKLTIAANSSYTIKLTNLYGDLDLFVLSSCTGNNAVVALSGNSGMNNESITLNNLPAGTYYLVVDGWNGCISNYLLSIICNANGGGNSCSNDDPCGAQVLYCSNSCSWTNCTNVGSTGTTNPVPSGGCNSDNMHDVWYAVQIPSTGSMHVTTGAGTMTNGLLGIYSGSNCCYLNCYGCIGSGNQMPGCTITGTPGTWIFLRIWGYYGSVGTFTLCVTTVSNGGNLQGNADEPTFAINASTTSDREEANQEKPEIQPIDAERYGLKVFPVPAQEEVNFSAQLPVNQDVSIRIFDLNGRLVKEAQGLQTVDGNLLERMEVGALPTGLYIVKIRAGETELTGKFTKTGN